MENGCDIVLVSPMHAVHVSSGEHLGIGYLAAGLRRHGYRVAILDAWLERLSPEATAQQIAEHNPSLCVGISAYASNLENVRETIRWLRARNVRCPCIGGGYGPTFHPNEFLISGMDIVVRGEGDLVLPQVCKYLRQGTPALTELPGVSYVDQGGRTYHNDPASGHVDLTSLPFPARDTLHLAIQQKNPVNILSSKGCLGQCAFCSIHTFERLAAGQPWRQRTLLDFVNELEVVVSRYGVTHFKIIDDSLIEPPRNGKWCRQLADELEKRHLTVKLRGSMRANRVTDEVVSELRRAGFVMIACGIENFAPTALRRIGKGVSLEDNVRALDLFRQHGLYVDSGYILFDDQTTLDELRHNQILMKRYSWTVGKVFTEMYAARATPFTKRLQRQGKILDDTHLLGNYRYSIYDKQAAVVYALLKEWARCHAHLYDMATNPLRGFRVLTDEAMVDFHQLYLTLHERELDVFGLLLEWVMDMASSAKIEMNMRRHMDDTQSWYEQCEQRLRVLYFANDLYYDVSPNPYL